MAEAIFDARQVERFHADLRRFVITVFPDETKQFMKGEGAKATKVVRAQTKRLTKKKTGNLRKGVSKKAPYFIDNEWRVRIENRAPHAHLLEYGHEKFIRGIDTGEETPGRHFMAAAANEFRPQFEADVDEFIDKVMKGLL